MQFANTSWQSWTHRNFAESILHSYKITCKKIIPGTFYGIPSNFYFFFFYILFFVGGSPETQRLQSDIFSISVAS